MINACAVLSSGEVECWGAGGSGQLGNGQSVESETPVYVSGLTDAVEVSVGAFNACALRANGEVVCWGDNSMGQLGTGNRTGSSIPVTVSGVASAVGLASGQNHSCVIDQSGSTACWGDNSYGQLGNGTYVTSSLPVSGGLSPAALQVIAESPATKPFGGSLPRVGYSTSPPTTASDWAVEPSCAIYAVSDSAFLTPLAGVQPAGDYVTHCSGGSSSTYVPTSYADGRFSVSKAELYVVPENGVVIRGGAVPTYPFTLHTGSPSGPEVHPTVDSPPVCSSAYAPNVPMASPALIICSGGSSTNYSFDTSSVAGLTISSVVDSRIGLSTCGLGQAGTISCWGWNALGQLGDGSSQNSLLPLSLIHI